MTTHSRTGTQLPLKLSHTPSPRLVQWMATLRCSLSCPHCLAAGGGKMADMALERALDLVDQCAAMGVQEFLLTGGEPMLREDLPEIIDRLARHGLAYSINTAVMPPERTLKAMRRYAPAFVAVSVDGPAEVHDRFRGRAGAFDEAMAAIATFKSLGSHVAAGTTLTTFNFDHLGRTLAIVAASGADSWGLHLAVPEGRAAHRPDLMLSPAQLRRLVKFVAAKRAYFPVNMADEIGYVGDYEPLVRDVPLSCGAGRSHCVILPDGSVVPCTTLDASTAAGNINDRPLGDIWRDGFAELRSWKPKGKCARCGYASACRGGCWLQRRSGVQCAKEAWHVPGVLKTAAGVLVCLGAVAATASGADNVTTATAPAPAERPAQTQPASETAEAGRAIEYTGSIYEDERVVRQALGRELAVEECIMSSYIPDVRVTAPPRAIADDPAMVLLEQWRAGKLDTLAKRAAAVEAAVKTEHPSLTTSALMWRVLCEDLLNDEGPASRSDADRKLIRQTLATIEKTTGQWRQQQLEKRLELYIAYRMLEDGRAMASKAGPRPPTMAQLFHRDTLVERWGDSAAEGLARGKAVLTQTPQQQIAAATKAAQEYASRHPYAEGMILLCGLTAGQGVEVANASRSQPFKQSSIQKLGIFDVLLVGTDEDATLTLLPRGNELKVKLPPGSEVTYLDLLRLACEQNDIGADHELVKWIRQPVELARPSPEAKSEQMRKGFSSWPGQGIIAMPAVRKIVGPRPQAQPQPADATPARSDTQPSAARRMDALDYFLADFWLF